MERSGTARDIARWVALGALFLVTLTPLLVFNSFFFPFITGKAFFFRIVVEVAVAAWAVLAFLDKAYRPRFSWIAVAVLAFVAWLFIADAFAPNAAKAFWSNFERMEGWILLAHLAGFFFAASAVLRVEKRWRAWFLASLAVSVIVSAHALLQLSGALPIHQGSTRIDSSFGNSAYLAIYLLFNVFIAAWLALTERHRWLRFGLMAFALLEAVLIFYTETRGAVLGLLAALFFAGVLTAVLAGGRARRIALGGLIALLLVSGGFYLARNSSFVEGNGVLARVASISLADGQVRFAIWHMALAGFAESPKTVLLGWGQEGFNYVFNRYYDPALYRQEPWFDRAHNAFLDWLTAGGLPAFLLFLSLWGSAFWYLWTRSDLSRPERIALTAALIGYAVHDVFVFDNLYSYVYFFAILALIDSQVALPARALETRPEISSATGLSYALPAAAVAAGLLIWTINVPGMRVANGLITAITPGDPAAQLAAFEALLARPAFAAQEVREQLVAFSASLSGDAQASDTVKQSVAFRAVEEMKRQITRYPEDARERLQLANAYQAAGDRHDALTEILAASALSPKKEGIWIEAAAVEWDLGDLQAAKTDFDRAYALGPQFPELAAYAAAGRYALGDSAGGDALLLGAYGTTTVDAPALLASYYRAKDWTRFIRLWEMRAARPDASVETLFSLAAAYYIGGLRAQAIATIRNAIVRYPAAAAAGDAAIAQIQSGTVR